MRFLNRAHRVAAICAATPLLLGLGIFFVWLMARWNWLMIAGAVVLYGGLAVVAAGTIALARSCWTASRTPGVSRRRIWVATLSCTGLLLANFLTAVCIISAVIAINTRFTVVVENTSQHQLDSVRVFGGGCDASYGSLRPGATARRSFWIRQDGALVFRASGGEDTLEQTIEDYVTNNVGGHIKITVEPDRTISVTRVAQSQVTLADRAGDLVFWRDGSPCKELRVQVLEPDGG